MCKDFLNEREQLRENLKSELQGEMEGLKIERDQEIRQIHKRWAIVCIIFYQLKIPLLCFRTEFSKPLKRKM